MNFRCSDGETSLRASDDEGRRRSTQGATPIAAIQRRDIVTSSPFSAAHDGDRAECNTRGAMLIKC